MGNDASKSLAERVTGPLPDGIATLDAQDQQVLADAIGAARRQQGEELAAAAEGGLSYVPKLLRGTVRKAVNL